MIYLIEGVLPEGYFANNLRGLSVDMAVFRDLLRVRLQNLSRHLDRLQTESKDSGINKQDIFISPVSKEWPIFTIFLKAKKKKNHDNLSTRNYRTNSPVSLSQNFFFKCIEKPFRAGQLILIPY